MNDLDRRVAQPPAAGPTSMRSQRVLYYCYLALIVIGALTVLIGLIQTSLGLLFLGLLLAGSGVEGIVWEMAHCGPRRSSSRHG
jgi:hypothetical protein